MAPELSRQRKVFGELPHFSNDDEVIRFKTNEVLFINGIGAAPFSTLRQDVDAKFRSLGFTFDSVIDPTARVSRHSILGDGIQILANAAVQTGATVERGAIINTSAIVEHDTFVGKNAHIAPGAVLAGGVTIGDGSFIGANAVVIEGVVINKDVIIGAGVTVLNNVESGLTYVNE